MTDPNQSNTAPDHEGSSGVSTSWLSARARIRLVFAGKALVISSLVAAAGVLIVGAERHKSTQPEHLVDLSVWNVVDRPGWSTIADVSAIRSASGLVGRALPLYDRDAAEIAREALDRTPRAKRVVSVRRVPPDQVEVVLEMRRPVAAVALADGRYVEVDAVGIVLDAPSRVRPVRDDVPLRVVRGAGAAPPVAGGTCADDVQDGLRLCGLLDAYRDGLGEQVLRTFDEVDVANHGGRIDPAEADLVLRASPPDVLGTSVRPITAVVEWGRLGEEYGEPAFESKARKLQEAVRMFGSTDFAGVDRLRVAFEGLTVIAASNSDGDRLKKLSEQSRGR